MVWRRLRFNYWDFLEGIGFQAEPLKQNRIELASFVANFRRWRTGQSAPSHFISIRWLGFVSLTKMASG